VASPTSPTSRYAGALSSSANGASVSSTLRAANQPSGGTDHGASRTWFGSREINDAIRGRSYDRALSAIEASDHPAIVLNYTISPRNEGCIEEFCALAARIRRAAGVFFYFVTPTSATDPLVMPHEARVPVVERLLRLKRAGAPVLNSAAALRLVARDEWRRPSSFCYLYSDCRTHRCCRSIGDRYACDNCGYLGYPELEAISRLEPGAILENLRVVLRGRHGRRGWHARRGST
jgi:hypothetical protein